VPFPFTSREQYERSIRQPLGKQWNTASATSALCAPRVTTKAGEVIEPMALTKSIKTKGAEAAVKRGWGRGVASLGRGAAKA
jgi:U3 small nucleolar RNA-associated protein 14